LKIIFQQQECIRLSHQPVAKVVQCGEPKILCEPSWVFRFGSFFIIPASPTRTAARKQRRYIPIMKKGPIILTLLSNFTDWLLISFW